MSLAIALLFAASGRTVIGVWDRWAAFRDTSPARCFAIARPVDGAGGTDRRGAFAAVGARVDASGRGALWLRLSRPARAAAPVTLTIGERRFALTGDGALARAPDAATDRALVAAMRGARSMSVSTAAATGAPVADTYTLPGAATAIDAATLACARR